MEFSQYVIWNAQYDDMRERFGVLNDEDAKKLAVQRMSSAPRNTDPAEWMLSTWANDRPDRLIALMTDLWPPYEADPEGWV